jgi:hypothetical protein
MGRKASKHTVYFRVHRLVRDEELRSSDLAGLYDRRSSLEQGQRRGEYRVESNSAKRVLVQIGQDRSRPALQTSLATDGVWEETLSTEVTLYENVSDKSYDPKFAEIKLFDEQHGQVVGVSQIDVAQFATISGSMGNSRHRRTQSQGVGECLLELRSSGIDNKAAAKHGPVEGVLLISIGIDEVRGVTGSTMTAISQDSTSQWSSTESSASNSDFATSQRRGVADEGPGNHAAIDAKRQHESAGDKQESSLISVPSGTVRSFRHSSRKQDQHGMRNILALERPAQDETLEKKHAPFPAERGARNQKTPSPPSSAMVTTPENGAARRSLEPSERPFLLDEASLWKRERDRFAKQLMIQAETFQEEIRDLSATNSALRVQLAALCREREAQQIFIHHSEKRMAAPALSRACDATTAAAKISLGKSASGADEDQELDPVPATWDRERLAREWQLARAGQRAAVTQAHIEVEAALRDAATRAMASLRLFTSWHGSEEGRRPAGGPNDPNPNDEAASHPDGLVQSTSIDGDERATQDKKQLVQDLEQQLIAAKMAHAQSEGRTEELRQALWEAQRRLLVEQQRAMELARELSQLHQSEAHAQTAADKLEALPSNHGEEKLTNRTARMAEATGWRRFTQLDNLDARSSDIDARRDVLKVPEKAGTTTRRRAHSVTAATADQKHAITSRRDNVATESSRPWRLAWSRRHRGHNEVEKA